MTAYYMGILVGAGIGYCVALITMVVMWALCAIAKTEEGMNYENEAYDKKE